MRDLYTYSFLFFLLLSRLHLPLAIGADAPPDDAFSTTRNIRNLPIAEGFAALKWGVSIEEAHKTYTDLREYNSRAYNQYIKGGKDEKVWLVRANESLKVGGHSMESIEYQFQKGKFVSVGAGMNCDEDNPCNIEMSYQDITKAIRRLYGTPHNIGSRTYEEGNTVIKGGGTMKTEEMEWKIDDESISVTKTVEPNFSSILISIFSYQGYFIAIGQER